MSVPEVLTVFAVALAIAFALLGLMKLAVRMFVTPKKSGLGPVTGPRNLLDVRFAPTRSAYGYDEVTVDRFLTSVVLPAWVADRDRIDALQRQLVQGRVAPEELPPRGDLGPEDVEGRSFPSFQPRTGYAMLQVRQFLGEVAEAWEKDREHMERLERELRESGPGAQEP